MNHEEIKNPEPKVPIGLGTVSPNSLGVAKGLISLSRDEQREVLNRAHEMQSDQNIQA